MNKSPKSNPPDRITLSRRTFLSSSAMVGAALPLAGLHSFEPAGQRPSRVSSERPVCIFSKHLEWLEYSEMAAVAAEIGFDGIDLTVRPGGHVLPERVEDELPEAVEAVRNAGLDVHMLTTNITDAHDPLTKPILRTAARLGIRFYRMGYLSYDYGLGVANTLEALRPQIRGLAEMNRQYGIHGAYQNHAGTRVGGPVWDIWYLINDIDPQWIGCQYDIRHAVVEGGQSWPLGLRLLKEHIMISAIKDFKWAETNGRWQVEDVPFRFGMVDFDYYFRLIHEFGISGPLSLHFEYPIWEDNLDLSARTSQATEAMRRDLFRLRETMAAAGL